MKDVQRYELFGGIAPKNHAFSLLSNCVFSLYHLIINYEFLILYLFTMCNLRELKLPILVRKKVYCIVL